MEEVTRIHNYLDAISLKEKSVEPDKDNNKFLTRNMHLGNIQKREFFFHSHRFDVAQTMMAIPFAHGGWLTAKVGNRNIQKLEGNLVLSGSVDGFVRRMNQTTISDQTLRDTTKKAFFSSLMGG